MELASYSRLFSEPFRITEPEFIERVEAAKAIADSEALCRAFIDLAFARIHMGQASLALQPANDAIAIALLHGFEQLETEARLWHDAAIHFSNDRTTRTYFAELAKQLHVVGLRELIPIALILRAREIDRVDGPTASTAIVQHALSSLEDVADPYVLTFVNRLAGMLLQSHEQFQRSTELFETARSVAEHANLQSQLARTISAMGSAYVANLRPKDGLTELLIALDLYEKLEINDWYVAETNLNLSLLHELSHEHTDAIGYAIKSIELFEAVGDLEQTARAENVLGALYEKSGRTELALQTYLKSNERFKSLKSRHRLSTLPLANAVYILLICRPSLEALAMLHEAFDLATSIDSSEGQTQADAYLGSFFDTEGTELYNPEKAEGHLLHGYALGKERNKVSPLILEQLAQFYEHHKQFERALTYTKELYEHRDRMRDASTQRRIEQIEARRRLEEAHKRAEIEQLRNVELKAAQTRLVESEKMASLGQLTAGIAHEINNPVSYIVNSIGPLRRDLDEYESLGGRGPEAEELRAEIFGLLNAIETGAQRTAEIVKSLRTFSRLDESSLKNTDIIAGIESTLTILNSRIRGFIEIVKEYQDIPNIDCRPGEINQVIMNILSNAVDALEFTEHPVIRIRVNMQGPDTVTIMISDNGPGISTNVLSKVFEPFFTTKDVGKGTGLGLSISYGIIERHHGRIEVSNSSGAIFTITLPVRQPHTGEIASSV